MREQDSLEAHDPLRGYFPQPDMLSLYKCMYFYIIKEPHFHTDVSFLVTELSK